MAFTKLSVPQNTFLVTHLRGTGKELTVAQARALYGIENLRARVCELRKAGLKVLSRKNYMGAAAYRITARDLRGSKAKVEI